MYGAILGDMIGSPYEFDSNNYKAKDFPLFCRRSTFTDDSVMTLAVADGLMNAAEGVEDETVRRSVIASMRRVGRRHPRCGYGGRFSSWLFSRHPKAYNSWGNGSAMRVSAAAWLYHDLETVRHMARLTAEVTHNHPEGIKGAEATASAIFLARTGCGKGEVKTYLEREFSYVLDRTCDEIRPAYRMDESCQGTVPEAVTAFLESTDFEDAVRTAVSLGGDSDTLAAIAGSIAEGYYGVPDSLREECRRRLLPDLLEILTRLERRIGETHL